MELLQTDRGKITTQLGDPIQLRGVCIGGWMNMESFIDGFPGTEQGLRAVMNEILGPEKTRFFFDRWLDCFFNEDDTAFIKGCGANAVRLPLNYRHFEDDRQPFTYLEAGFERLELAVRGCEQNGLYVILDMHAIQGGQNPDWHSDNPAQTALFWKQAQYQDRFVALWEEIARRYAGNPAVAGYDLINEPLTNELSELATGVYRPDWETINRVYRRAVQAIRRVDPDHIIFLEGDGFASKFGGLEAPFADNLAYSSHNYTRAGWGPGAYPGHHREGYWDAGMVERVFRDAEGTSFAREHSVPLWVGEFGSVFNGARADRPSRYRGLDDSISVFDKHGAHWTAWTYKDIGVMGWVTTHPESEFIQRLAPVLRAKDELYTDTWMYWMPETPAKSLSNRLAEAVAGRPGLQGIDVKRIQGHMAKAALGGVAGSLLQVAFARTFEKCSENEMDRVLQSFALKNCVVHQDLVDIVRSHLIAEQEPA